MEAHPADAPLQCAASLAVRWLGGDEASAKTYSQLCLGNAVALECCALRLGAKIGRPSSPSGARAPTPSSGSVRGGIAVQMAGLQALWLTLTPTLTPTLTLTLTLTPNLSPNPTQALWSLAHHHDAAIEALQAYGGLHLCLAALRQRPSDAGVQEWGLSLLWCAASHPRLP
eukprot:scaffold3767_cov57-Phaeocystis_antarctica.AAC.1